MYTDFNRYPSVIQSKISEFLKLPRAVSHFGTVIFLTKKIFLKKSVKKLHFSRFVSIYCKDTWLTPLYGVPVSANNDILINQQNEIWRFKEIYNKHQSKQKHHLQILQKEWRLILFPSDHARYFESEMMFDENKPWLTIKTGILWPCLEMAALMPLLFL